jgi:hypothetical protein
MRKLKFVKTFESFKVNEEVPFNFDEADIMNLDNSKELPLGRSDWSEKERLDLQRLGADSIERGHATFVEKNGMIIDVYKESPLAGSKGEPIMRTKSTINYRATSTGGAFFNPLRNTEIKVSTKMPNMGFTSIPGGSKQVEDMYLTNEQAWRYFLSDLNTFIKNGGVAKNKN